MYINHLINLHTSFHNMNSYTSFIPCYGSWLDLRWNSGSSFTEDPVDWSLWVPTHLNWFSIEMKACKEEEDKMRSNGRGHQLEPRQNLFFFFFQYQIMARLESKNIRIVFVGTFETFLWPPKKLVRLMRSCVL